MFYVYTSNTMWDTFSFCLKGMRVYNFVKRECTRAELTRGCAMESEIRLDQSISKYFEAMNLSLVYM